VGLEQEDFQIVLRAAGGTETTQGNIQNWFKLDEGDPGFQLLTEEEIVSVIFFIFIGITYNVKISIYLFSKMFCLLGLSFF
jgi:hypothetical protein